MRQKPSICQPVLRPCIRRKHALMENPGLWEVRSILPSRRIARVLFCVSAGELVLLHGFIKKTQKTPPRDLRIAAKRMKEVES